MERVRATSHWTPGRFALNPVTALWHTMVGKKIVMAVTGAVWVAFLFAHVTGNLKLFSGAHAIDAYAVFLREAGAPVFGYGELLWLVRIVLLVSIVLHITAAAQLTRMSLAARPAGYDTYKPIETTFAALTMRWSGVLIALFVIFHLLHLSTGAVGFRSGQYVPLAVYHNMLVAFMQWPITAAYVVAMAALCLHLDHAVWSMFQTVGWSPARRTGGLKALSRIIAAAVFVGFVSVPVAVLAGWVH